MDFVSADAWNSSKATPTMRRRALSVILLFIMQACALAGPAATPLPPRSPPPPMDPFFNAYRICILQGTFTDSGREDCFKQTIQVNHLSLPAGTTAEQAYAEYKNCLKKNAPFWVLVGPFMLNNIEAVLAAYNQDAVLQSCFRRVLP